MIYSEVKVFDSIMKWVKSKPDSRKSYLKNLLKSIRWCHLEDKDLAKIKENIYVKSSDFDPKLCCRDKSGCNCSTDRTKQKYFIAIEKLDATNLRVKVLDKNFFLLVNQEIQSDESLPLKLIHNEHVSDVFFESGRKMIRIDWKQNKYRLLEFAAVKSHFFNFHKLFFDEQKRQVKRITELYHALFVFLNNYLKVFFFANFSEEHYNVKINNPLNSEQASESSLLEADDKFILVRFYGKQFKYWAMPTDENIRSHFGLNGRSCLGTVLDNNIYMLTDRLELITFNIDRKCEFERIEFDKYREKFYSNSLLLTANLTNDKVIIIDKSTKELFCYNVKTEKWSSMGRISNCDSGSDGKTKSHDLIAFTSTFLSMDAINACLNMNSNE
uniref:BACK domain-containing protein n=1 Tax=Tetranychus urticae TaxID=32264 RepID=T1L5X9_TETUR